MRAPVAGRIAREEVLGQLLRDRRTAALPSVFCNSKVFTATRANEGMSMPEWLRKRTSSVEISAATMGGTSRPSSRIRSVESEGNRSAYCT